MSCKIKNYKKKREENKLEYLKKKNRMLFHQQVSLYRKLGRCYINKDDYSQVPLF